MIEPLSIVIGGIALTFIIWAVYATTSNYRDFQSTMRKLKDLTSGVGR